jgi:hypothetical protein
MPVLPRTSSIRTVVEAAPVVTSHVNVTESESPAGIPETAAVTVTLVGVPVLMPRDAAVMDPVVQALAGSPVTRVEGVTETC